MEPPRRRNGRPQACEPCRKRKVACDHTLPVCRRCMKRNTPQACEYLTSPENGRLPDRLSVDTRSPSRPSASSSTAVTPLTASASTTTLQAHDSEHHRAEHASRPGYLGPTSFSAVFQETQNSLSLFPSPLTNGSPSDFVTNGHRTTLPSVQKLEKCVAVLQRIPPPVDGQDLFGQHLNPNDGWIRLAAKELVHSIYREHGRHLGKERNRRRLEEIAQKICANTAQALDESEPDAQRWLESFSGQNLRWDALGICFTYWAFACISNKAHRPEPTGWDFMKENLMVFRECVELCVELCKDAVPNSLLLYLVYKRCILQSIVTGDASPGLWRCHGECIALLTYLGLHADSSEASYTPTASSEARRRLVSQIFNIDKVAASFAGRPPLLSRRFLLTPLPLDLDDEDLMAGGEQLSRAIATLDSNGWGRDGKLYSTTILRARCLLCRNKDEVMELALGHPSLITVEKLLQLKAHVDETKLTLPPIFTFNFYDVRDATVSPGLLYAKILTNLEHLQNKFFIERLLGQKGYDSYGDLLSISYEMVSITLVFWTHMDRLSGMHGDYEWLVMAFAAPAGGILCNELLNPVAPRRSNGDTINRSDIIQQLSLLIGFLDWVSPSAPNGDLCGSCKTIIQRVLDQTLNGSARNSAPTFESFDFDMSSNFNDYFNFDLLDTFDWLRPEMSSSQQSG